MTVLRDRVPTASEEELRLFDARMQTLPARPVFPEGAESECADCGGKVVTTNDLIETLSTPEGVVIVANLPGARCLRCGATELDGAGAIIVERLRQREVVADFETSVTRTAGRTLGTYFRADLVRNLALRGGEALRWKVLGRDRAVVEVVRGA